MIIILLCGLFWRLGGWDKAGWSGYRDVLIPLVIGIYASIKTENYILGILLCGSFNIIRIGYGAYDPEHDDKPSWLAKITKDRKGAIIRGIVGVMYGLVGLSPAFFMGHIIDVQNWLGYCFAIGALSYILCEVKAKDFIIEPVIGALVGCSILLIKGG